MQYCNLVVAALLIAQWQAHGQQCTKFNNAQMGSFTLLDSVPDTSSCTCHV